jgi:tetratricopeptide (TPR) repeat protein
MSKGASMKRYKWNILFINLNGEQYMKKSVYFFAVVMLLSIPLTSFADEAPLPLPAGASAEAVKHNDEGIAHFGQGHYDVALQHFEAAAKAASKLGEACFNEAMALDKLGKHADATKHFKSAQKNANGNKAILESAILNAHTK